VIDVAKIMTKAGIELERHEAILDGWRAVHVTPVAPEDSGGIIRPPTDYVGYLTLTTHRLLFIREVPFDPGLEVDPDLCIRLDDLLYVQTGRSELELPHGSFRIPGAELGEVRERIRKAILGRLHAIKESPPREDEPKPISSAAEIDGPGDGPTQPGRMVKLERCSNCGLFSPADSEFCQECGKRLSV
jgi:hypothetical protein